MASGVPGNKWEVWLDAGADVYVARLRPPGLVVRLPRRTVEAVVFAAAEIALELAPDGCLVVRAENNCMRPLTGAWISALVVNALTPASLEAKGDPTLLPRLEADLETALEAVRHARRHLDRPATKFEGWEGGG